MTEDRSLITSGAYMNTLAMSTQSLANMEPGSSIENTWDTDYIASSEIQIGLKVAGTFLGVKKSARIVRQSYSVKITKD